ncbi:hypothetical protein CHCC20372_4497 [Bacillus paralicheniformis]|nr:hypothetical protein CHCC5027_1056 [Bacillus paralicheniformis]TWK24090.1 hypothetical protein CHCC20372_4497 [Bacillus paralicheniformis]
MSSLRVLIGRRRSCEKWRFLKKKGKEKEAESRFFNFNCTFCRLSFLYLKAV